MPSRLFRALRVAHVQLDQGTDPKPTPLSSIGFTSNSLDVSTPVSKPDARMRVVHVQLDKSLHRQRAAMPRIRLNRLLRTSPVRFRATKEIPTWQQISSILWIAGKPKSTSSAPGGRFLIETHSTTNSNSTRAPRSNAHRSEAMDHLPREELEEWLADRIRKRGKMCTAHQWMEVRKSLLADGRLAVLKSTRGLTRDPCLVFYKIPTSAPRYSSRCG